MVQAHGHGQGGPVKLWLVGSREETQWCRNRTKSSFYNMLSYILFIMLLHVHLGEKEFSDTVPLLQDSGHLDSA